MNTAATDSLAGISSPQGLGILSGAPIELVLAKVSEHQFPALVKRLQKKLGLSEEDAQLLFEDTKKFLYLCSISKEPLAPNETLDFGWHEFLLFSQEYADFCRKHFGRFIHHHPVDPDAPPSNKMGKSTQVLAKEIFGKNLSANWCYPAGPDGSAGPCDSCGCSSACNGD